MAVSLDATVAGASANSYLTQAEGTTFLEDSRLYVTDWTDASSDDKDRALIWATYILDRYMEWDGFKRTREQALRWPRSGAFDADGESINFDIIPELLKQGAADLALELLKEDRLVDPEILGLGIDKAKVGPLSIEVNDSEVKGYIPDYVLANLASLGSLGGHASRGGGKSVPVERT